MKYLIVIATLVVSCMAAPTQTNAATLDRPSPINPSVLSDTKPVDKIIPIKDEKTQDVKKPFAPTVVPAVVTHHENKHDHESHLESHNTPKNPHTAKDSEKNHHNIPEHHKIPEKSATDQKRSRRDVQPNQPKNDKAPLGFQKPQTLPALIPNNEHKVYDQNTPVKPQTLPALLPSNEHITPAKPQNDKAPLGFQKPQTLPALIPNNEHKGHDQNTPVKPQILPAHTLENKHQKRNVHTPLVPKENPTDDSSKNEENLKEKKDEEKKEDHKAVVNPHTVQVEDLSEHKLINHKHLSSAHHLTHEFHPQVQHPHLEENKPITLGEVQQKPSVPSVAPVSGDIQENPVIRKKPVPVAELFSRHHDD